MSKEIHDANEQTGKDMHNARQATTIDVAKTREFLYNGADEWKTHRKLVDILSKDQVFSKTTRTFMSRTDRYNRGLAMTDRLYELAEIHQWSRQETATAVSLIDDSLPISLHNVAFEPVFNAQSSPELLAKYRDLIATRGILGCYMQTELGHGTNVASLETTATFIPEMQEFEIHSPTLTSSKWWIGALGKTSTHGVVQAKLILPGGKDMGPHLFFVQLRSLDDHKVLPGMVIGDIGPKALAGFSPTDNGYVRFSHVRIPKENMLSKFAQVTPEGQYVTPPHAKISYGGMLSIRSGMVTAAGWLIAKAATVSIRYTTVRRQGERGPDGLEKQVLLYPSTFSRLLPILSRAYVFIQLGRSLTRSFDIMSTRLASGDTSLLGELHAMTSGLKVLVTTAGIQDIEAARRSMGGHGYSAFAGLGRLYADYLPSATYEGENFVLDGQVIRAALKSHRNLFASKNADSLSPSSSYLRLLFGPRPLPPKDSDWLNLSYIVALIEWRAAAMVHDMAQNSSLPSDAGILQRVSKAATEAFVAKQVEEIVRRFAPGDPLGRVYMLYLLSTIEGGLVDLLSFGLLQAPTDGSGDITRSLRLAILKLSIEILPNAIGLTDAFGFSDWELDSALGVYDGKVYEALWQAAKTEPLNQTEVPEAYEKSIKPMLARGQRLARKGVAKL